MSFDRGEVDRLLTTTKAVRRRLDLTRPVPRELIAECIGIGCYAPNASNAQEWWWVVVDDADQKARVAEVYRDVLVPRVTQMLLDIDVPRYGPEWEHDFLDRGPMYARIEAERMFAFHMPAES